MRLVCTLILLLWLAACAPAPKPDGIPASQHRQQAQALLEAHKLPAAILEMQQVLASQPTFADTLLYADLLEATGAFKDARRAYKRAARYPTSADQKLTLTYRQALLEAVEFDNLGKAARMMRALPKTDSRFFDLKSILLFKRGQYKQALKESRQALTHARNNEQRGWAYFHIAQIYYELQEKRDTFSALFQAINNGRGHSLVRQITDYWEARRHNPTSGN